MKIATAGSVLMTINTLSACTADHFSSPANGLPLAPVHNVSQEPRVVPVYTSLIVQADDAVIAIKAMEAEIYTGTVAEDVEDEDGTVLTPKTRRPDSRE